MLTFLLICLTIYLAIRMMERDQRKKEEMIAIQKKKEQEYDLRSQLIMDHVYDLGPKKLELAEYAQFFEDLEELGVEYDEDMELD